MLEKPAPEVERWGWPVDIAVSSGGLLGLLGSGGGESWVPPMMVTQGQVAGNMGEELPGVWGSGWGRLVVLLRLGGVSLVWGHIGDRGDEPLVQLVGNAPVARGGNDGNAAQAEPKELLALTAEVARGKVGFVPSVRDGDNLGRFDSTTIGVVVGVVDRVRRLHVVLGLDAARRAVVVVKGSEHQVGVADLGAAADLDDGHGVREGDGRGVLDVDVVFEVPVEALLVVLPVAAVNVHEVWSGADEVRVELGVEGVEVGVEMGGPGLGVDAEGAVGVCWVAFWRGDVVELAEAVGGHELEAVDLLGWWKCGAGSLGDWRSRAWWLGSRTLSPGSRGCGHRHKVDEW